jgi:hypothetical protein
MTKPRGSELKTQTLRTILNTPTNEVWIAGDFV